MPLTSPFFFAQDNLSNLAPFNEALGSQYYQAHSEATTPLMNPIGAEQAKIDGSLQSARLQGEREAQRASSQPDGAQQPTVSQGIIGLGDGAAERSNVQHHFYPKSKPL